MDFYTGAAGPPGRFHEGFSLRRIHGLMGSAFRVARSMANVPRPFLATSSKQISFTAYLSI